MFRISVIIIFLFSSACRRADVGKHAGMPSSSGAYSARITSRDHSGRILLKIEILSLGGSSLDSRQIELISRNWSSRWDLDIDGSDILIIEDGGQAIRFSVTEGKLNKQ
jgi:hypothetical protein